MKTLITPTNIEKKLNSNDFIVSKTDNKGIITYCNQIFISMSGYSEQELIGKQHNIIRHPDMPRAVFFLLWQTLQLGKEFFGYVKNMRKDGGFYWVYANITPRLPVKKKLGYYSVRRAPRQEMIDVVSPLYAQMLAKEQQVGAKDAINASTLILENKLAELDISYEEFSRDY
ncbi:MAG: PAS domain-containing protein [gamma proteobacterium symbiont of Taylorina sp.]|nr:PAS domain-containing protein [gamma proteobacterium symbiont of Taylorina sp.]